MSLSETQPDPETYARENKETLVRIIKHGNDQFVRSLALAVLIEYGDDPDLQELRSEIDQITNSNADKGQP